MKENQVVTTLYQNIMSGVWNETDSEVAEQPLRVLEALLKKIEEEAIIAENGKATLLVNVLEESIKDRTNKLMQLYSERNHVEELQQENEVRINKSDDVHHGLRLRLLLSDDNTKMCKVGESENGYFFWIDKKYLVKVDPQIEAEELDCYKAERGNANSTKPNGKKGRKPISSQEHRQKFRNMLTPQLSEARKDQLIETLSSITAQCNGEDKVKPIAYCLMVGILTMRPSESDVESLFGNTSSYGQCFSGSGFKFNSNELQQYSTRLKQFKPRQKDND